MITAAIRYFALCLGAGVALGGAWDAAGDLVDELRRDRRPLVSVKCPTCASYIWLRHGDVARCSYCSTPPTSPAMGDIEQPASSAPAS